MSEAAKLNNLALAFTTKRMWINILMGFSAGLPIWMVYGGAKIWLRRSGVDLSTIGLISWVMIPYSLNFMMGPFLDRFVPLHLGRRRSWIFIAQVCLVGAIATMGLHDPAVSVYPIALSALFIALFSATQDVAIDAYKREILPDAEIGLGSSLYVYGYRIAMWVASGLVFRFVGNESFLNLSFNQYFFVMAGVMSIGIFVTLWAHEPKMEGQIPANFKEMIIDPFKSFFHEQGVGTAFIILGFIFMFKFGDAFAGTLLGPYYVDMGYSNTMIADVTKTLGLISTFIGLAVGAVVIYRFNIVVSLFCFGILQSISTALFSILSLASVKGTWWGLAIVVGFEDFSSGLGTTALVAFMAMLTDKKYTATQYALFASLAALGRTIFGGFSGYVVEAVDYVAFFLLSSALAIPGLILIYFMHRLRAKVGTTTNARA